MKHVPVLAALVMLVQLAAGCTPKAEHQASAEIPSGPQPQLSQPSSKPKVPARAPAVVPTRAFDESLLRGHEFLLEIMAKPEGARDFDLGELSVDLDLNTALEAFFHDAADGSIEQGSVNERWTDFLNSWASSYKTRAKPWDTFRTGRALEEDGELLIPFKLLNRTSAMSGWLAATRNGEKFVVNDVQISELVARTGPFDPDAPQEISSPNRR